MDTGAVIRLVAERRTLERRCEWCGSAIPRKMSRSFDRMGVMAELESLTSGASLGEWHRMDQRR